MADRELRGRPVRHRQAALFGLVGLIAATHRIRPRQEDRVALRSVSTSSTWNSQAESGAGRPRLSVDQEQRDEPVTVMTAGPAAQQHLGVLRIELQRPEFAVGQRDQRRPMHRHPLPDLRLLRLSLRSGPPVPRPLRPDRESAVSPAT